MPGSCKTPGGFAVERNIEVTPRAGPQVSVVMPTLNQRRFLPEAVDSVLSQQGVQVELIVADGGSTDGTLQWLAQRARTDERVRWHSQPDSGPAQAVNRALQQARGTLIGWLNSDDRYANGALQRAAEALHARPDALMVYGHARHIDEEGHDLGPYPTLPPPSPAATFADGCFICQPTVVMRRTFALLNGPLDESLHTAFDLDWWLRAFTRFPQRIGFVDALQADSRLHAGSITLRQRRAVALEAMQLLHRHLGHAPNHWVKTWVVEALQGNEIQSPDDAAVREVVAIATPWMSTQEAADLQQWLTSKDAGRQTA